ncbi:MAG: hypothetical protein KDB63_02310 [Nocardioidaceae bacterium]|nr:hypothetical protein [Nocardioidaceae bacterium]
MRDAHDAESGHDEVGSLGEETAKLLGAFAAWARDSGSDLGAGLGAAAAQAAAGWNAVDEHIATGAPECQYCPICRTVHAVRETSPEVRAHLASAAVSLLQAAAALLATAQPDDGASRRSPGVEHIDVGDDDWTDGPEEED